MNTTLDQCPPKNELLEYLSGRLPVDQIAEFESHFNGCNVCEDTIRNLSDSDTLSKLVADAFDSHSASPSDREFVNQLVDQIQARSSEFELVDQALYQRAAEVLQRLDPTPDDESLGKLAHYQIDDVIGAGSTGVVFRATDLQLKRSVALKVLRPSLGQSARQRFVSEAQIAASIDHPNVVTIYQVSESNDLAFIAMQWIEGETLESRLKNVTFIPESHLSPIIEQIAAGLHAAHQKNLIHRDIKPANIWLAAGSDQVKILDFGLARIADDDPHMTNTGMLAGTPNFMSPEQAKGLELDGRSDLFSLGCLLYRSLTGKLPFGASGILSTLQAIQNHQPASPSHVNSAVSGRFSDLTMWLLDKQPANRPESARQLETILKTPTKNWTMVPRSRSLRTPLQPTKTQPASNSIRWIAALVAAGVLGVGFLMFGPQIIRIATDHGELVIETDEKDVQVELISDRGEVKVVNTWAEQTVNLKSGSYQIRPKHKDGQPLDYSISKNKFVMRRGGKQNIAITLNPPSSPTIDTDALANFANEPRYDGRTFDAWLAELKPERSKTKIAEGLKALAVLAQDSPNRQRIVADLIRPLARKYGSNIVRGGNDWPAIIDEAFSKLTPEVRFEFVIHEMNNGNTASLRQSIWLLRPNSSVNGIARERNISLEKAREIFELGFQKLSEKPSDLTPYHDLLTITNSAVDNREDFDRYLFEKIQQSFNTNTKFYLSALLLDSKTEAYGESAIQLISENLENPNLSPDLIARFLNSVINYNTIGLGVSVFPHVNDQQLLTLLPRLRLLMQNKKQKWQIETKMTKLTSPSNAHRPMDTLEKIVVEILQRERLVTNEYVRWIREFDFSDTADGFYQLQVHSIAKQFEQRNNSQKQQDETDDTP